MVGTVNLERSRRWITDILHWLAEGKMVFLCIFVLLVALLFGLVIYRSEISIRSVGCGLQIIGMIFAIWGLLDIRNYFRQPPLWNLFVNWWGRRPKWNRHLVLKKGKASYEISMNYDIPTGIWTKDDPNQPLEKRIEGIIKNLDRIKNEHVKYDKSINELKKIHEDHLKTVAKENKELEETIHSELEFIHTNDLLKSLVGIVWLTVGLFMSTMAPELSKVTPELLRGWQWLAAVLCALLYMLGLLICFPSAPDGKFGDRVDP